jgi:hypothetical protein
MMGVVEMFWLKGRENEWKEAKFSTGEVMETKENLLWSREQMIESKKRDNAFVSVLQHSDIISVSKNFHIVIWKAVE